jgi:hypothetical protein
VSDAQLRAGRTLAMSASVLGMLGRAASALLMFFISSWDGPVGKYRPEDHYMRGPGPKWREKHSFDRASAGGA